MAMERSGRGILGTVVVCLGVLAGLLGAGMLLLGFASFVVADALFERRWPWLSVPASTIVCLCVLWLACRNVKLRRELVAKVRAHVLACRSCGDRLPPWNGFFRRNPYELDYIDWIGTPPESFRIVCGRSGREPWFYADAGGIVARAEDSAPVPPRSSEDRDRQLSHVGGVIVNLDEP